MNKSEEQNQLNQLSFPFRPPPSLIQSIAHSVIRAKSYFSLNHSVDRQTVKHGNFYPYPSVNRARKLIYSFLELIDRSIDRIPLESITKSLRCSPSVSNLLFKLFYWFTLFLSPFLPPSPPPPQKLSFIKFPLFSIYYRSVWLFINSYTVISIRD